MLTRKACSEDKSVTPQSTILLVALSLFIVSLLTCVYIWQYRRKFFRESFALSLAAATFLAIFYLAVSITIGVMPWYLPQFLIAHSTETRPSTPMGTSDYILLAVIFFAIYKTARRTHKNWTGLKSARQYKCEQRNDPSSLLNEAYLALKRLIRHQAPLQQHTNYAEKPLPSQLQPSIQIMSWKERARDLVRLFSSAYIFDRDSGWRDTESCWVGENLDNGKVVLLHPIHSAPSTDRLASLSRYASQNAAKQGKDWRDIEIIVALSREAPSTQLTYYESTVYRTESSLLDSLVDFSDYRNEIRRRVVSTNLPESNLRISDTYVPSEITIGSATDTRQDAATHITQWLQDPGQRQLALLGEYGQGKSTAALMFTYHTLCTGAIVIDRIPLLIELRGTSPRNLEPLGLLATWSAKYNISPQALMQLHLAGRLLLIFEGFDEMSLIGDTEMRLRHFKTLWDFCSPSAKIIITGRPNFFLDEDEMKAALGIAKPIGNKPYCEALRVSPFTISQIRSALRSHSEEVQDQICSLAETNPRFYELVSRPSLLHAISVLWKKEALSTRINELTSAYVMDLFIRHSYTRQGRKDEESLDSSVLNTAERAYFMSGIATYMATNNLPNQISGSRLNECIEILVQAMPDSVSLQTVTISGESRSPLRLKMQDEEYGEEQVKTDVRACGILVDDPAAPGTFRFAHKSFLEYLFAEVIAENIRDSRNDSPHAILRATGGKVEDALGWPVALEFVAELLEDSQQL